MSTLLIQIEAILNTRPLCPLSSEPNDVYPLTPAHLLTGRPFTTLPETDVINVNESRLNTYKRIKQLQQHFWKSWTKIIYKAYNGEDF